MAKSGKRRRRLSDGYSFAGFGAKATVRGVFGDPDVRIVRLDRRSKKRFAAVVGRVGNGWYDRRVRQVRDLSSAGFRIVLELEVRRVACRRCGTVKRERLDFLADNPHVTKRFAFYVGRRCRQASIRDVAKELKLDWDTVKTLEKQYMRAQLEKEAFGQLWDYGREGWARRFFDNWRASLKWQRLGPYERFADMIDRHWDGIAAYCKPENKVSLGFVEGLNNKIRVFQRRAYGLRDDEYLRLKVLTCMLPPL
jgi:transposase